MAVPVAVIDPLPMYRQGVTAVLSTIGQRAETPADLLAWVRQTQRGIVLLTLDSRQAWQDLSGLQQFSQRHLVIAVLEDPLAEVGVRAVRAGARSVLWRTATAAALLRAVEATLDGQAVLPAAVAAELATAAPTLAGSVPPPEPEQLSWLRQLAAGSTVAQLAAQVGYSERAMFRLLRALYQQMGVATRTEAIVQAHELGWLTRLSAGG